MRDINLLETNYRKTDEYLANAELAAEQNDRQSYGVRLACGHYGPEFARLHKKFDHLKLAVPDSCRGFDFSQLDGADEEIEELSGALHWPETNPSNYD